VLVSIDTLRADFLEPYGHSWVRTPCFAQLAQEATLFEQHWSVAPSTLAAHASMMTGLHPHGHGAPRNSFRLPQENLTLAELLSKEGFATAAFIGGYPLSARFAFAQGFQVFDERFDQQPRSGGCGDEPLLEQSQRDAASVTAAVLDWLPAWGGERLFLFVHYFDPHAPYTAPAPYDRMYRDDGLSMEGSLQDRKRVRRGLRAGGMAEESRALMAAYGAEVTYVDHQLGRLLQGLDERGLLNEALLAVTADHGEAMAQHWEIWNHGQSTYEDTIRTPLLLRLPGGIGGGQRVSEPVSAVDLLPTTLELLGVAAPGALHGRSLAPALAGGALAERPLYAEATKPANAEYESGQAWRNARKCHALRQGRYKLLHCPQRGLTELYDLQDDPDEQRDLLQDPRDPALRQRGRTMLRELETWIASASGREGQEDLSVESRLRLQALGYLE